jgi:hypothetical protein
LTAAVHFNATAMSAKKKTVSASDFVNSARREFEYLVSEFGFKEDMQREKIKSPRCVCYEGPIQLVSVEGFSTTSTVQVNLTVMVGEGEDPVRLSLPALVQLRTPGAREVVTDMLKQLARDAELLRTHAAELLRADANAKAAAQKLAEEIKKAEKLERKQQKAQEQGQGVS